VDTGGRSAFAVARPGRQALGSNFSETKAPRSVGAGPQLLFKQSGNQVAMHKTKMGMIRVGMPMVDVTAPDGSRELWAVAAAHSGP
jgi:hypothetical protein